MTTKTLLQSAHDIYCAWCLAHGKAPPTLEEYYNAIVYLDNAEQAEKDFEEGFEEDWSKP